MSDANQDQNEGQEQGQDPRFLPQNLPLIIHAQYIRDLSFENPQAPDFLKPNQPPPQMNVNIGMDARPIEALSDSEGPQKEGGDLFEVSLHLKAQAVRENGDVVFIAEVDYGVLVELSGDVSDKQRHPLLLIEVPKLAFPFVRQIIGDLTRQGGLPPLLLNPPDFYGLYLSKFRQQPPPAGTA